MRNTSIQYWIYQELIKKGGFSVWMDFEFWLKWFESDIVQIPDNIKNLEDFYFSKLIAISIRMQKLNLDLKNIIYCVEKIATLWIKDNTDLLIELRLIIVKQFNNRFEDT